MSYELYFDRGKFINTKIFLLRKNHMTTGMGEKHIARIKWEKFENNSMRDELKPTLEMSYMDLEYMLPQIKKEAVGISSFIPDISYGLNETIAAKNDQIACLKQEINFLRNLVDKK